MSLVLVVDKGGMPKDWVNYEMAACYYAKEKVLWELGTKVKTMRGGHNQHGEQSRIDISCIIGVSGPIHGHKFYSRQTVLAELGRRGQEKLRRSKVAVVGLGGLGTISALYLALAGVGHLRVAVLDPLEFDSDDEDDEDDEDGEDDGDGDGDEDDLDDEDDDATLSRNRSLRRAGSCVGLPKEM